MVLVDANILLDIWHGDLTWGSWSRETVRRFAVDGLAINPLICAEVSVGLPDAASLERRLDDLEIARLDLPYEAAFRAGRAFAQYRRAGGLKRSPLPDFYIGAHAEVAGLTLLTRDATRYRTYFPGVRLVAP